MNIIIFDMDKTLVSVDTIGLWAEFLHERNIMDETDREKRAEFDLAYREHRLDHMASYKFELMLLKRIPPQLRESWRLEFFEQWVKPNISNIALQLVAAYKKQPATLTVLATATISYIAAPVAQFAGVHHLIATQEEIINGDYTGKVSGIPSMGPGKLTRFQQWLAEDAIAPRHTVFYSDSMNDLPLLAHVDTPIVVDPDQRLYEFALQRQWKIVSFLDADPDNHNISPILADQSHVV